MATVAVSSLALLLLLLLVTPSLSQQPYTDNAMLDCYTNKSASTLGYACNGRTTSCSTYATFRAADYYQTPVLVSYLLNVSAQGTARLNSLADVASAPLHRPLLVPLSCSCFNTTSGSYYQHDASYTLKWDNETYMLVANDTFQGLSTCQAIIEQNPAHDSRHLDPGIAIRVPLRCACPTAKQAAAGYKYLLSYLVTWGDDITSIAKQFGTDEEAVAEANSLRIDGTIFPFTTLLVPLKQPPSAGVFSPPPPPPASSPLPPPPEAAISSGSGSSSKKWVGVGIGIGAGVMALCAALLGLLCCKSRRARPAPPSPVADPEKPTYSTSSEASLLAGTMAVYKYEELQRATGFFAEDCRIGGSSVYRATINGDPAAVKRMNGDVSGEIAILKNTSHANLVRLSGYCLHGDSTYLVFEFLRNGSLHDLLHGGAGRLGWKQRMQIAVDVADAVNYLHNLAAPACVHKDLASSNVLLDGELRAKVANFGLARSTTLQVTGHVVGTQGYMAPEYVEHGVITPKLDVFSIGVLLLELLSGKEAVLAGGKGGASILLAGAVGEVLEGEDVREKLRGFVDPRLGEDYLLESAYAVAQLARRCVTRDPASRPPIAEVYVALSAIHSAALDWDRSWENTTTTTSATTNAR